MSASRTIIIGDIHACYVEFVEFVELLELLRVTDDDRVISVGDLVDRGPDPRRVLELFRDRPNSVVLAGNHERKHVRQVFSYAQEITRLQLGAEYDAWVAWMATLPYAIELEAAIVVHAAAVPGVAIADQKPEILCGSTAGEQELSRVLDGKDLRGTFDLAAFRKQCRTPRKLQMLDEGIGLAPLQVPRL